MSMLMLPKICRSNGKMVNTAIDATDIKGIDEYVHNGIKGAKIYTSYGWFFSPLPLAQIAMAKCAVLKSGEPIVLEAPSMKALSGGSQSVPQSFGHKQKMLSSAPVKNNNPQLGKGWLS